MKHIDIYSTYYGAEDTVASLYCTEDFARHLVSLLMVAGSDRDTVFNWREA